MNLAFVSYFYNLTTDVRIPIQLNWTTYEQILPNSLEDFSLEPYLLKSSKTLKDIEDEIENINDIFLNCTKNINLENAKKKFFLDNHKVDNFLLSLLMFSYYLLLVYYFL